MNRRFLFVLLMLCLLVLAVGGWMVSAVRSVVRLPRRSAAQPAYA
jgi:hypothetical protein